MHAYSFSTELNDVDWQPINLAIIYSINQMILSLGIHVIIF